MGAQAHRATQSAKPAEVDKHWYVVDAADQVLGRLATRLATVLRGKHKPSYTPHVDTGDFVVVVNAEKVRLTGRKAEQKVYHRHTGYPGGIKSTTAAKRLAGPHPERVLADAVRGMLPKNALGRKMGAKLKVYAGPEHPHAAQKPEAFPLV
ncbi:MAG: 50S ribosomal protein L13 [Myxococcota bacterium]